MALEIPNNFCTNQSQWADVQGAQGLDLQSPGVVCGEDGFDPGGSAQGADSGSHAAFAGAVAQVPDLFADAIEVAAGRTVLDAVRHNKQYKQLDSADQETVARVITLAHENETNRPLTSGDRKKLFVAEKLRYYVRSLEKQAQRQSSSRLGAPRVEGARHYTPRIGDTVANVLVRQYSSLLTDPSFKIPGVPKAQLADVILSLAMIRFATDNGWYTPSLLGAQRIELRTPDDMRKQIESMLREPGLVASLGIVVCAKKRELKPELRPLRSLLRTAVGAKRQLNRAKTDPLIVDRPTDTKPVLDKTRLLALKKKLNRILGTGPKDVPAFVEHAEMLPPPQAKENFGQYLQRTRPTMGSTERQTANYDRQGFVLTEIKYYRADGSEDQGVKAEFDAVKSALSKRLPEVFDAKLPHGAITTALADAVEAEQKEGGLQFGLDLSLEKPLAEAVEEALEKDLPPEQRTNLKMFNAFFLLLLAQYGTGKAETAAQIRVAEVDEAFETVEQDPGLEVLLRVVRKMRGIEAHADLKIVDPDGDDDEVPADGGYAVADAPDAEPVGDLNRVADQRKKAAARYAVLAAEVIEGAQQVRNDVKHGEDLALKRGAADQNGPGGAYSA